MSSSVANRAWIAAARVGAVEALKDQVGICRWNYTMRVVQKHVKHNVRSYSGACNKLSSSYVALFSRKIRDEETKGSEESMKSVMYLKLLGD